MDGIAAAFILLFAASNAGGWVQHLPMERLLVRALWWLLYLGASLRLVQRFGAAWLTWMTRHQWALCLLLAWSVLSILVAGAPRRLEPLIMTSGALMIAGGIAGFAYAVPSGSIPAILFCALLQGGGFGILWPFASRRIISAAAENERDIAAAAFSTLQRMGYAIGAALAGMIANANGFSGGFTREAAQGASVIIFLAFLPIAVIGCIAAWRLSQPQPRLPA